MWPFSRGKREAKERLRGAESALKVILVIYEEATKAYPSLVDLPSIAGPPTIIGYTLTTEEALAETHRKIGVWKEALQRCPWAQTAIADVDRILADSGTRDSSRLAAKSRGFNEGIRDAEARFSALGLR